MGVRISNSKIMEISMGLEISMGVLISPQTGGAHPPYGKCSQLRDFFYVDRLPKLLASRRCEYGSFYPTEELAPSFVCCNVAYISLFFWSVVHWSGSDMPSFIQSGMSICGPSDMQAQDGQC